MGHWQNLRLKMTTVKKPNSGRPAADNRISAGSAGLMSRLRNLTVILNKTFASSKGSGAFGSITISGIGTPGGRPF
jgi:hypothetical protein